MVQHDPPQPPSNFGFWGVFFARFGNSGGVGHHLLQCHLYRLQCHPQCHHVPDLVGGQPAVTLSPRSWWPELGAVQQPQHLDTLLPLEPVDQNERGTADDQLARALHATGPTHLWVVLQHVDLALDLVILIGRREWVVFRDVVELVEAVAKGRREPVDDQAGLPFPLVTADALRERHAARRFAPSAMAASFDTHWVEGSSASLSA